MLLLLPSFAHALLPSLRALPPRYTRSAQRAVARLCMDPVRVELSFEGGLSEVVSLTSEESIVEAAEELSEKHGLDPETSLEVEMELWNRWYQAADEAAPVYEGTSPEDGVVSDLAASLELQEAGLVLEVGRSVVAPNGRGLFIRCTDDEVSLSIGTAVCGYAAGSMHVEPDRGGKAVGFALDSLDASCWFEKQLLSVRDVLELPDVDAIVGHEVIRAASGELADYAYWESLPSQTHETSYVRHVRLETPLEVVVDGMSRRGVVMKQDKPFEVYVAQVDAFMAIQEANEGGSPM